jgi:AcrR family transcriptional regulator
LDAATDALWTRGYHALSLNDLVDAMDLNKSSFYNSFSSKRDLAVEVIDHYAADQVRMLEALLSKHRFRSALTLLFTSIIEDNNDSRGCLLVNCAAELAREDRQAAQRVSHGFGEIALALANGAERAKARGEIDASINPHELATSLVAYIAGLRILAKTGMDQRSLRVTVDQLLDRLVPAAGHIDI